eukprot:TRINITY_DN21989_c0_g1_i1.p1 TRINITY_DN21989_c0_g1~~TRINITY_DN21989_c0_g1_i1.p1  ORF type:complete len:1110 (+),score=412.05 TRINITY_DN21989_c0_g1_i1:109-3438(+)
MPGYASSNATPRCETPSAPEEFQDILSICSEKDPPDAKLLKCIETLFQHYATPDGRATAQGARQPASPAPGGGRPFTGRCGMRGLPQLIQVCGDKARAGKEEFREVLVKIFRKLEEPLNVSDVRDDRRQQQAVLRTLDALGGVLSSCEALPDVSHAAARSIEAITRDVRAQGHDDIDPPPATLAKKRDVRFRCLETADTVLLLCKAIRRDQPEGESLLCLQALRDCTCYRKVVTRLVDEGHVIDGVLALLQRILEKEECLLDPRIAVVLEIIWNTFDLCYATRRLPADHLTVLYNLFAVFLHSGHRLKDKELRNDVLTIMTMVAGDAHTHEALLSTGWMKMAWLAGCGYELIPEKEEYKSVIKPFATTMSEDDFDMKVLLWHMMYLTSFSDANLEFLLEHSVIEVLLSYLDHKSTVPAVLRWPLQQLVELQSRALKIVCQLCVGGTAELRAADGVRILLTFLHECSSLALRDSTIRLMSRVATTENRTQLALEGAMGTVLNLATSVDDVVLACECLKILACLCDGDEDGKQQFAELGGIDVIMSFLTNIPEDSVLFACIDCVWCCVIGFPESELIFVEAEGIHVLLDVLAEAPKWIAVALLSCLSDFVDSSSLAGQELLEWQSAGNLTAAQLLIKMWQEDEAGGAASKAAAVLPDDPDAEPFTSKFGDDTVDDVLGAAGEAKDWGKWAPTSLVEVTTNAVKETPNLIGKAEHDIKVKIYCLFQKGIPADSPALQVLSNVERMQYEVIQNYASLKRDCVWKKIGAALESEGTVPIGLDRHNLSMAKTEAQQRWNSIRARQEALAQVDKERSDAEVKSFYKLIVKKTEDRNLINKNAKGLSITEAKIRKAEMLKLSFMSAIVVSDDEAKAVEDDGGKEAKGGKRSREASVKAAEPDMRHVKMEKLEEEVTELLSQIRHDPSLLLPILEARLENMQADGTFVRDDGATEATVEGRAGVQQAISFIKTAREQPQLAGCAGLGYAARDHVADQIECQQVSHTGSDKSEPLSRMNRYGMVLGQCAESMALGYSSPLDVVCSLVVNDGLESKQDRLNLFDPEFKQVGVACAMHPLHKFLCVIEYAVDYKNSSTANQRAVHERFTPSSRVPTNEDGA